MAGQVHQLIEKLVSGRAAGNKSVELSTRTKLLMQGIDSAKWTPTSPDDAAMIAKVRSVAGAMGVSL